MQTKTLLALLVFFSFFFTLAFFNLDFPLGRFRWFGKAHVIPGVDSEAILPSRHDVNCSVLVIEQPVSQSLPGSLDGIPLGDHVVQPVVFLLIW